MFKSITEMKKALNGKVVIKSVVGGICVEDMEEFKQSLLKQIAAHPQGSEMELVEDDTMFRVFLQGKETNNYVMKPKRKRHTKGTITFRSKDFYVENEDGDKVYGDSKGCELIKNGFKVDYGNNNIIQYVLA